MAGRPPGLRTLVRALGKLSPAQVRQLFKKAKPSGQLERLEHERDKHMRAIQRLERQMAKLSGGNNQTVAPKRRWRLSVETRRKMAEAAKRRWSKANGSTSEGAKPKAKRRPFSAETRAKMAEAQKRRWAKAKATVGS